MERHIISDKATIIEALEKLNLLSGGRMTLVVTDDNGCMCGTLTDGDVRRAFLRGVALCDSVADKVDVPAGAPSLGAGGAKNTCKGDPPVMG